MANSIPETIRIGGTDYTVKVVKDLRDGNTGLNGHILYNNCEIRIEEDMTEHIQWVTAWHEVIHGILEHAGMSDHKEDMVCALGYGITQVLRDNEYLRNG